MDVVLILTSRGSALELLLATFFPELALDSFLLDLLLDISFMDEEEPLL
jgi:hypothetical protein